LRQGFCVKVFASPCDPLNRAYRARFFASPFAPCDCGAIRNGWLARTGSGIVRIRALHGSSPIRS
jgi:hypothetical protein